MTECIRACGKLETCSLAFMLGKQCFAVSCYSGTLCVTKPAFSPFYKPKISYVKHKKEPITGKYSNYKPEKSSFSHKLFSHHRHCQPLRTLESLLSL